MSIIIVIIPAAGQAIQDEHLNWYLSHITPIADIAIDGRFVAAQMQPPGLAHPIMIYHVQQMDPLKDRELTLDHVPIVIEMEANRIIPDIITDDVWEQHRKQFDAFMQEHANMMKELCQYFWSIGLVLRPDFSYTKNGNVVLELEDPQQKGHVDKILNCFQFAGPISNITH